MINIMLCTEKMDLVAAFYRAVGVELVQEQHGAGPVHFSFPANTCLEIYPPRQPADAGFVLRVDVPDIEVAMSRVRDAFSYQGLVVSDVQALKTGKKSILCDPDGRVVELFQAFTPSA
jgi:lactoylglutathione lyase